MNITDINCMIGTWPSKKLRFEDRDGLLKHMDLYGITNCIAFNSAAAWNPKDGNDEMFEVASKSDKRIKAAYVIDPALSAMGLSNINALSDKLRYEKPAAVRMNPNSGMFCLDDFFCGEILEVLNEFSMPLILAEGEIPSFEKIPLLARNYPEIKFIILRHGFRDSRYIFPIISKLKNVFFDTSLMVDTGLIEEIVMKYGSDKLLFGSGMPFYDPTGGLGLLFYARISERDKEKILGRNWEAIEGDIQWK